MLKRIPDSSQFHFIITNDICKSFKNAPKKKANQENRQDDEDEKQTEFDKYTNEREIEIYKIKRSGQSLQLLRLDKNEKSLDFKLVDESENQVIKSKIIVLIIDISSLNS